MDKRTALKILKLDGSASKQDAKKAYRRLAKMVHPDVIKEHRDTEASLAGSMEDINLAFDLLLPLLPDRVAQTADNGQESVQENSGSSTFLKKMQHLFDSVFRTRTCVRPVKKQSCSRPASSEKSDLYRFNDIFLKACRSNTVEIAKKKRRFEKAGKRKAVLYGNRYGRYWARKKKIRSARPSKEGFGRIGRVEKVTPVRPVDPVRRHG